MRAVDQLALAWLGLTSVLAFVLFGFDKWRAGRTGSRVSEWHLVLSGAAGGWWGGLLAMWLFRHKTAKGSFQLKYALGFLPWAALVYGWFRARGGV